MVLVNLGPFVDCDHLHENFPEHVPVKDTPAGRDDALQLSVEKYKSDLPAGGFQQREVSFDSFRPVLHRIGGPLSLELGFGDAIRLDTRGGRPAGHNVRTGTEILDKAPPANEHSPLRVPHENTLILIQQHQNPPPFN